MNTHVPQRHCQQGTCPRGKAFGRGFIEFVQKTLTALLIINRAFAGPEIIGQPRQTFLIKARAPFTNAGRSGVQDGVQFPDWRGLEQPRE
jgi:hypothetical protein